MERYRQFFPVCDEMIYFNHAGVSPISTRVVGAVENYIMLLASKGGADYAQFLEHEKNLRNLVSRLIGCKMTEVAFVKNTSQGISMVANGIRWKKGDVVLIPENEFPSNVYPWMALEKKGVKLRFIPVHEGRITIEQIEKSMTNRVRLISVSSVEYGNGFRNDIEAIGKLCSRNGIYFFVDAIQSLGAFPLDVRKARIDFLAADAHKWLLGPEGIGIFYVSDKIIDEIDPTFFGWHSVVFDSDFDNYDFTLKGNAQKFEEGSPNMMGIFALEEAIELLMEVGIDKIQRQILHLTDVLLTGLKALDVTIMTPLGDKERSGIVSFRPKGHIEEIFKELMEHDIICAMRAGGIRVAPHFYNTEEEVDKFFLVLEKLIEDFK
jgi:selenocysteine lyase/cysteine desulfurase